MEQIIQTIEGVAWHNKFESYQATSNKSYGFYSKIYIWNKHFFLKRRAVPERNVDSNNNLK